MRLAPTLKRRATLVQALPRLSTYWIGAPTHLKTDSTSALRNGVHFGTESESGSSTAQNKRASPGIGEARLSIGRE